LREEDKSFSLWRSDLPNTPEKRDVILVKFPKNDHSKYLDIMLIYSPTGEPIGDWGF
jgi:hypothetical protein